MGTKLLTEGDTHPFAAWVRPGYGYTRDTPYAGGSPFFVLFYIGS